MSALTITDLDTGYDDFQALFGVSLEALARQAGLWSFKSSRYLPLLRGKLEEAVAAVRVEHAWGRGAAVVETAGGTRQGPGAPAAARSAATRPG